STRSSSEASGSGRIASSPPAQVIQTHHRSVSSVTVWRIFGMNDATRLTTGELILILLQIPGAIIFGLGPFLIPGIMLPLLGYAGDDPFIARAAGAAVFGYAAGAFLAIRQDEWIAARLLVLATLVFHAITLVLCAIEFGSGAVHLVVYAI